MGLKFNTQSLPTQSMIYKSDSNGFFLMKLARWQIRKIENLIDRNLFRDRFGLQAVANGVGH